MPFGPRLYVFLWQIPAQVTGIPIQESTASYRLLQSDLHLVSPRWSCKTDELWTWWTSPAKWRTGLPTTASRDQLRGYPLVSPLAPPQPTDLSPGHGVIAPCLFKVLSGEIPWPDCQYTRLCWRNFCLLAWASDQRSRLPFSQAPNQ